MKQADSPLSRDGKKKGEELRAERRVAGGRESFPFPNTVCSASAGGTYKDGRGKGQLTVRRRRSLEFASSAQARALRKRKKKKTREKLAGRGNWNLFKRMSGREGKKSSLRREKSSPIVAQTLLAGKEEGGEKKKLQR